MSKRRQSGARPRKNSWLNDERLEWLRSEYPRQSISETIERFEQRFGVRPSYSQMSSAAGRFGLGSSRNAARSFTRAETDWLRDHVRTMPRKDLLARFSERFGRKLATSSLNSLVHRRGWQGAPNLGRYRDGHPPHNKGVKGCWGPNSGSFQPGHKRNEIYELGAATVRKGQGAPLVVEKTEAGWLRKARVVWERAHGPIPDGCVIVQIDGNPLNCDLDNLECVPRAVIARMNHFHAPKASGPETAPARLRLAQLRHAITERTRDAQD